MADVVPEAAPEAESAVPLAVLVANLAAARSINAHHAGVLAAARASAEQEFAFKHGDLVDAVMASKNAVAELDAKVRAAAVAQFADTQNKKPVEGVTVQVTNVLRYKSEEALEWAKESGLCLALDSKAFEKIAKATPIPCVTLATEVKATIATDLSLYLPPAALDEEDMVSPAPEEVLNA